MPIGFESLLLNLIVSKLIVYKTCNEIFYDSGHNNWNLGHKHSH